MSHELTKRGESLTHLVKQLADWSLVHKDDVAESRRVWDLANPESDLAKRF